MPRGRPRKAANDEPAISNGHAHTSEGMIDAHSLKGYVERIARLMVEQKELSEDIKEIAAQCDEAGVATKREVRQLARESLMDPEVLRSGLDRMDALRHALGEFVTTPLGGAAVRGAEANP